MVAIKNELVNKITSSDSIKHFIIINQQYFGDYITVTITDAHLQRNHYQTHSFRYPLKIQLQWIQQTRLPEHNLIRCHFPTATDKMEIFLRRRADFPECSEHKIHWPQWCWRHQIHTIVMKRYRQKQQLISVSRTSHTNEQMNEAP